MLKDGSGSYAGGLGGYSYGTLTLASDTTVYICIGGQGGYNGGGNGSYNSNYSGENGGGSSDIRISQNSLYSRVIVAGGGGGGCYEDCGYNGTGGAGGVEVGANGK